MNVHFLIDNIYTKKFINFMLESNLISDSYFIIITYGEVKYVKQLENCENIKIINWSGWIKFFKSNEYKMIKDYLLGNNKIFIHFLSSSMYKILFLNKPTNVYWVLWGADFYNDLNLELFQEKTRNILDELGSRKKRNKFKGWVNQRVKQNVIKNMSHICFWNYYDYKLIKEVYSTNADFIEFFYPLDISNNYNYERNIEYNPNYNYKKKFKFVIQVGNSADPSNNHIEILEYLSKLESKDFAIFVPLSYGQNNGYTKIIIEKGFELLGERFIPLSEYLDLKTYNFILSQVDVAIMNHNRQQGVGNIVTLLNMGKKVYVNESITTYNDFKVKGISLYGINNDLFQAKSIESIVYYDKDINERNIKNIYKNFNDELCKQNIINLIK